eukprot:scaffold21637_cov55-Phaeocystis_antarctica.AAC.2
MLGSRCLAVLYTVYNWGRLILPACYAHSRRKAPQLFHRAPRARVPCVRVLISVHIVLLQCNGSVVSVVLSLRVVCRPSI